MQLLLSHFPSATSTGASSGGERSASARKDETGALLVGTRYMKSLSDDDSDGEEAGDASTEGNA